MQYLIYLDAIGPNACLFGLNCDFGLNNHLKVIHLFKNYEVVLDWVHYNWVSSILGYKLFQIKLENEKSNVGSNFGFWVLSEIHGFLEIALKNLREIW